MRQLTVPVVAVVAGTFLALIAVPGPTARRIIVGGATHRRNHADLGRDLGQRGAFVDVAALERCVSVNPDCPGGGAMLGG